MVSKDERDRRKRVVADMRLQEREARAALMPLDRSQLVALLQHVEAAVDASGCDHTLEATDSWAERHGVGLERLHEGLEEGGGYCDCEVAMNVHEEDFFAPAIE